MIKTKQFVLLYLMNTCSVFIGLFIAAEWKVYWQTATNAPTDHFMATAGSFGSVFNGMRFIWSWLLDHYSYKAVYGTLLVVEITVGVTMPFLLSRKWLYTVWICVGYWCLGGHFTLLPNQVKKVFGGNATQLYSIIYTYIGIAGITESVLQVFVLTSENLTSFFYIYSLLALCSLVILLTLYEDRPYRVAKD